MKTYRITFEAVFDVEAVDESDAMTKLPDTLDWGEGDIVEIEEVEE